MKYVFVVGTRRVLILFQISSTKSVVLPEISVILPLGTKEVSCIRLTFSTDIESAYDAPRPNRYP